MSIPRLTHKDVREVHAVLVGELGYEFVANDGNNHFHYTHPISGQQFRLAGTPGDWRWKANAYAELKRQNPEHPFFARRKSDAPRRVVSKKTRRAREEAALRARMLAAAAEAKARADATPTLPEYRGCVDCGHRLLSDRDPMHGCPRCGGVVVSRSAPVTDLKPRLSSQPWEPKPSRRRAA